MDKETKELIKQMADTLEMLWHPKDPNRKARKEEMIQKAKALLQKEG